MTRAYDEDDVREVHGRPWGVDADGYRRDNGDRDRWRDPAAPDAELPADVTAPAPMLCASCGTSTCVSVLADSAPCGASALCTCMLVHAPGVACAVALAHALAQSMNPGDTWDDDEIADADVDVLLALLRERGVRLVAVAGSSYPVRAWHVVVRR